MDKYSKTSISSRIKTEQAEALRKMAKEREILISDLVQEIYDFYFNNKTPEPVQQKECIVLTDMQPVTVAALFECSEKLNKTYGQTIDLLFSKVIDLGGAPEQKYIEKTKELFKN